MTKRFSARDEQLLSDYLDGRLPEAEQAALKRRLSDDGDLREALDALRKMKVMLRHAPRFRAPRNFTLSPAAAGVRRPPAVGFWAPLMRFTSAAAVFLLAAVFILEGLPGGIPAMHTDLASEQAAPAVESFAADNELVPSPPPIIIWNAPADGRGGGSEGPAAMKAEPPGALSESLPEEPAGAAPMMKEPAAPETDASAAEAPPPQAPAPAVEEESVPIILGIRPTEERAVISAGGEMEKAVPSPQEPATRDGSTKEENIWLWIKIALGLVALSTGTAAVLLQKKAGK